MTTSADLQEIYDVLLTTSEASPETYGMVKMT